MDENKMTELNRAIEGMWDSLTDEQKAAVKECRSMDELAALAGAAGVELPDEMLDAVAGGRPIVLPGGTIYCLNCPYCKKTHQKTEQIAMITPAGESRELLVDVVFCGNVSRRFYYSSERNTYYDDNYRPVTVSSGGGC
ncbi:MAG: hypothetical protein E7422_00030 [Ruminococcaceae bacterium]|jgi:hypothetical protein|nr:hypothetical protein [Oscillospiraceae bacterium]